MSGVPRRDATEIVDCRSFGGLRAVEKFPEGRFCGSSSLCREASRNRPGLGMAEDVHVICTAVCANLPSQ